jgi:two-component SAPR family response regulator
MEVTENTANVRIRALGGLDITGGMFLRGPRRVRVAACRELLIGLIAAGLPGLPVWMLCEALWPEAIAVDSCRALLATVQRLGRNLGCRAAVCMEAGRVRLNAARCWVDAWAFEEFVGRALAAGDEVPPGDLLSALELYQGSLFGPSDSRLVRTARERLRRLYAHACFSAGRRMLRAGDVAGAIGLYERALEREPSCEELYRALILAQAACGQPSAACETYERCRRSLQERFGTAPSTATARARLEPCTPQAGSGEGRGALAASSASP